MPTSLDAATVASLLSRLAAADGPQLPPRPVRRQPIHTLYGGAQLFSRATPGKLADAARAALATYAAQASDLAHALGLPVGRVHPVLGQESLAESVHRRLVAKLSREPVEDLRIDFEDGFGVRSDADEDAAAATVGAELAAAARAGDLPPWVGIRLKPLGPATRERSVRTLDLTLTAFAAAGGPVPTGFIVTLPKVDGPEQVAVLALALDRLETALKLPRNTFAIEVMVELTGTLVSPAGQLVLPALGPAAAGRLTGAHFGTYDYTASAGVTAVDQRMGHPAADFARAVMQACLGPSGVFLSDGATLHMPIGPHRGPSLTPVQQSENRSAVHAAWRQSYEDISHSLKLGFFQGWDLHPAQLPARFATVYTYFLRHFGDMATRLTHFLDQAARATQLKGHFDDAATGQGLLTFFARAAGCGAVTEAEVVAATGLSLAELRGRDLAALARGRAAAGAFPPPPRRA